MKHTTLIHHHFPIDEDNTKPWSIITDREGFTIGRVQNEYPNKLGTTEEYGEEIVKRWNSHDELLKQNKELLHACKVMLNTFEFPETIDNVGRKKEAVKIARKAINND